MFFSLKKQSLSLAEKIKRMVFITSVTVLLVASVCFMALEWSVARQSLVDRISLMSELVAEHLTASVSFGDQATAKRFLNSFRNNPEIEYALVVGEDNKIFASYLARNAILPDKLTRPSKPDHRNELTYRFSLQYFYLWQIIELNNQPIGTLYITVSLKDYWTQLLSYLMSMLVVIGILILLLQRVAKRFKQSISGPIDTILERMIAVQNRGDYSVRLDVNRSDELGDIMSQFNNMVAKIESRDQQLVEKNQEIEKHAFYDPLTGLPNRRLLAEQLKHEIRAAHRTKQYGAVFYIDLDNFKTINDSLGHDSGDKLLWAVADRIRRDLRESDICARIGGDEFIAVLPDLGECAHSAAEHALSIAEQLRSVLTSAVQVNERFVHTSASIGISLFNSQTESAQELLKQSDMAMYAAKDSGRNCSYFFSEEMQEDAINRLNLEEELREALKEPQDNFELFYQAQVNENGECVGAEALIRWHHPLRGLVPPGVFIPLAEKTGLIVPLGNWIIDSACKQLALWQKQGNTFTVAINVSSNQFLDITFSEYVKNTLALYNVMPGTLEIEITESIILDDKNKAVAKMAELRDLGLTFSIDDFGTGYSSLQYLTTLPISKLKIDQSFVRQLHSDDNDAAVVKTIILMTKNLGLKVLAEGVEHKDEYDFLLENGCGLFQGYLFSKPIDIQAFEQAYFTNKSSISSLSH
ncbi:putative bifunctional diguanylate cyclase/phosphodiesterase [Neptuniibacter sp. QD72_48]|uniref:putative bifunctional diguanylate cyclase/phosphodiesterase n=1 Tax=unclassified Neptuniibacter TaxID=2630693 RepID=UPI0039F45A14